MHFPHLHLRCMPQRYVVAIELFLILMGCYMLRFSLSYAIPKMTKVEEAEKDPKACPFRDNATRQEEEREYEFHWTAAQQGFIHAGLFYGYIATQIIGGILADLFNHKVVLMSGFITSIVCVLLTPAVTILFDYIGLIIIRVILGLAQGITYVSMFPAIMYWAPNHERAMIGSLVFTGVHMGNVVNGLLTGYLLVHFEWQLVFYFYGTISAIIAIIFIFTTYTYPDEFPGLSEKEKAIFEEHKKEIEKKSKHKKIPFKAILTNIHVWAIVIAAFGNDFALFTLVLYMPSYLNRVQHIPIDKVGYYIGAAFILLWIYATISTPIVDCLIRKNKLSTTLARKIFFLIAAAGPSFAFLLIALGGCSEIASLIGLLIGYPILGLYYASVKINGLDLSPHFSGTIFSIGNCGGCIAGLIVPQLIASLTPNNFVSEWSIAFLITSFMIMATGALYFVMASGELQEFDSYGQEIKEET
ncbi:hypothetical protein O3M35_011313 [Rhynocoris fuscipes]|uniref:Major facilitator superfamily (MFS) profile domain-containing protein n=1 Tax=Rhynocoris fuscipes TaxID=488301 RepID=A0AAW1D2I3_9HEMI